MTGRAGAAKRGRMARPALLPPTPRNVEAAARALAAGELVAFPTETVYGLGADATDGRAVARVFEAKGRPRFNPLIAHVAAPEDAFALGVFGPLAREAAARFWPGPLTLVVRRAPNCPVAPLASAGLGTVALRVPGLALARELIARAGRPIAAPSANRSGRISPTRAAHVVEELGGAVSIILDGGPCEVGLESTVLDLSGGRPILLRPGGTTREALEKLAGPLSAPRAGGPVVAPGMLASHYAPSRPLRLDAAGPEPGEAYLAFGPAPEGPFAATLSADRDLAEAAANLFGLLRALDRPEVSAIAVAPIPETGLGRAIVDRLRRAAAPR